MKFWYSCRKFLRKVSVLRWAVGMMAVLTSTQVFAQEITAIDFNGDLLGKVIPDGKVVGFDNQLIGNVTADSLIVNFDGKLIGGVIPQGVAIGNDAKLLGKVNNDGSVRLASGQVVGKVLPNGLVVNDYFDIIGAVLFPGLVYSDDGSTVGRVTGDGNYTNLQGQSIGVVTPDGYAYRNVGNEYILDGRLISSKMVVSLDGDFIGSVVPGGSVSDFDSQIIGHIKANGYAYDSQNKVIGRIVKSGYAFDNDGYYMGFVTYNGEVIENENLIGHMRADGAIVSLDGEIIGYGEEISATATNLEGKYIGRLMPEGNLARAKEITALVGARGVIVSANGSVIGQLSRSGPVFDYKGSLRGHALPNGTVIALSGTPIGYMISNYAYDLSGRIIGAVMDSFIAYGNQNNVLGITGIGSNFSDNGGKRVVSPFGYVFDLDGNVSGSSFALAALYNAYGNPLGRLDFEGMVQAGAGNVIGRVLASGYMVSDPGVLTGGLIKAFLAIADKGGNLGHLTQQNLVVDKSMNTVGKILPDMSIYKTNKPNSQGFMPVNGWGYASNIVNSLNGNLLGYADVNGDVKDLSGAKIGRIAEHGWSVDNNNILNGHLQGFGTVSNDGCEIIGVIGPQGNVQNYRGIYLGRLLANGQALSDSGSIIGFSVQTLPIIDYNGKVIGFVNADGKVRDFENRQLGCVNRFGEVKNNDGVVVGATVNYTPVIDFKGKIIGRTVLDGVVVDEDSDVIGYQQPNGNVNSEVGKPIGNLFKYKIAFDLENKFIGRVMDDGSVMSSDNRKLGNVDYDGYVADGSRKIGYALYDFYMYDAEGKAIGIISRKGDVVNFNNQNMGTLDRGFLVDKKLNVLARGNRDYNIRDKDNVVIGWLSFDGVVIDSKGAKVGDLGEDGRVKNSNGEWIAQASPLQYYSRISPQAKRKMIFDKDGNLVGYLDENGNVVDKDGNIIGSVDENGNFVDGKGNVLGDSLNKKEIYDKDGNLIGYATDNGTVLDKDGNVIGRIGENGDAVDANGNIIGGIGSNWYEKAPQPEPLEDEEDISPALEFLENGEYRKSLGIALTPDGDYLGEILEDGTVVDENGNYLGRKMPDGLIIDDEGSLIGIEEVKKADTSGMFVPPGTFGNGGAYGTGAGPTGNLGPGGGFGPGERYDPVRQAALNTAMGERRKNMSVGKISNGTRKEAFDGMQKDWSEQGVNKVISSWRVDLSSMIFADKPIPAVIARAIDSNNPAPITAFVERNVYAEEGRNVIIPAGSRLMGSLGGLSASAEATSESARVQISWERLIRPDGSLFMLNGLTADAQGRAGALGYVDQQLFKKYTLPVMTTTLTSATSYFMAPKKDSDSSTETPRQEAANDARQNFLNEMNKVFDEILADKSNIRPMTYIPAGTRIIVYPMSDLWLRTIDNDEEARVQGELAKGGVLIDDEEKAAERKQAEIKKYQSAGTAGDVVYDAEGEDVNAVKSTPLIDGGKSKSDNSSAGTNFIAPPPPPSSSSAGMGAPTGAQTQSDSNVPALF